MATAEQSSSGSDESIPDVDLARACALATSIATLLRAQLGAQALPLALELEALLDAARGDGGRIIKFAEERARRGRPPCA